MWVYETSRPVWKYMANGTLNIGSEMLLVDDFHFSTARKLTDDDISTLSLYGTVIPRGKVAVETIRKDRKGVASNEILQKSRR